MIFWTIIEQQVYTEGFEKTSSKRPQKSMKFLQPPVIIEFSGLSCISCKELAEFGLKSLQSECNSCCAKSDEEVVQYKVWK